MPISNPKGAAVNAPTVASGKALEPLFLGVLAAELGAGHDYQSDDSFGGES